MERSYKVSFGVFLPFYAFSKEEKNYFQYFNRVKEAVLECERLGYDSVWLDDHLMFGKQPILEAWTTLSALSSVTKTIRLGTMVLSNSFRNPALLAKMSSTLDVVSNGRLEFGIGAGIQKDEHTSYGLPFPRSSLRVDRMREAIEIIKSMWTEEKTTYEGRYYKTKEAFCEPKPLQKPHPPITIGGSGEKYTLKVTAQHADRFDWGYLPASLYKHKLTVLENHCKAVGREPQKIEKSCWPGGQIFIAHDRKELDKKLSLKKTKGVSLRDFKKLSLAGTPNEWVDRILYYAKLGATYFMLFFGDLPNLDGVRVFAETVTEMIE